MEKDENVIDSVLFKWLRTLFAIVGVPIAGAIAGGAWNELAGMRHDLNEALNTVGQQSVQLENDKRRFYSQDLRFDRLEARVNVLSERRP